MARRLVPFVLALALAGCVTKPTMKLNHADVTGVQIAFPPQFNVVMMVYIDVHNPNSYDVAVRAMRGQVTLGNHYTVPIDFRANGDGVWMPANRTTTVQVPVNIPVEVAIGTLHEAYLAPSVPFHMTGRADVTATRSFQIERDDYSVDESGYIPRQQIEASIPHF